VILGLIPMTLQRRLGKNIRRVRKLKNLTQAQLGERLGFEQTYVSRIELGKRNISTETIQKIIQAMDIDAEDLFKP
jgi:transcriptional regulator with XRE-family HTH domain